MVVEEREAAAASLGKKRKQTDESEGRGNQKKKENPRKKGGSRVFSGRRAQELSKKKVRKSKEKNGPKVRGMVAGSEAL